MIPDFPVLKEELNGAITRFMRDRFKFHQGPLSDVPQGRIFEGRRNIIVREDGSEDETKMQELSAKTRIFSRRNQGASFAEAAPKIG